MKNKILSFIFAICLVMPCMFIMTACGEKGAPKYNVVLNGNDGVSSNTIQVTEGEQVAWPTNPVKENYDFVGWTTDAEGENFWNFKSSVTGNLNLYAQFVEDDVYEYELSTDGNSYIIVGAKAGLTKVVTPLTHLGKPVTEIGDMAFSEYYEDPDLGLSMRGNENITQIILNPSIVKVGEGAFSHCKNVESIFMYDSVTTIETSAFQEIEKLKSLTLSNSLTTLNVMAFTFCTSLEKVTIPESLTYISQRCFNNCTSLKEVVLHDKLTQIKDAAFGECSSLKTITIPSSVTSIGIGALMHTDITSVTLGENVTSLGDYVFWGCDSLTTATINARLTKLPKETFKGCTSLTTVNLPNTIETISQSAFEDCVNLTSLTLPSSCTTISYYAFKNCEKLETFTFNNVLERIDIEAFKGCSFKIESLPSTLSYIGDKAFLTFEQEDVCFEFPSTLRYIGEEVFSSDAMQNFCIDNLPVELKHIGGLSINGSRFGIEINVPSGTETIYEQAFYRAELEDVVLPKGVERIEREAFRYSTICSINIPSTVTYIGPYAFADCPNLTTIIFETDGNVEIDENAFTNSTSLKTLIIPNGTTAIADYA